MEIATRDRDLGAGTSPDPVPSPLPTGVQPDSPEEGDRGREEEPRTDQEHRHGGVSVDARRDLQAEEGKKVNRRAPSDYVIVLYQGHVAEAGPPDAVIGNPQHEYTQLLIDSIPWPDIDRPWGTPSTATEDAERLDRLARENKTEFRGRVPGFELDIG